MYRRYTAPAWCERWDDNELHTEIGCLSIILQEFEGAWDAVAQRIESNHRQQKIKENEIHLRAKEELESLAKYGLNSSDLRDASKWVELLRQEDWENNPVYGLQDFELVEATERRYVHKVTRCRYAELWKSHGNPEIGYQIHCHTDIAWWERPAWNPKVRFEQPKTLMQGDDYCLFIQYLPQVNNGDLLIPQE